MKRERRRREGKWQLINKSPAMNDLGPWLPLNRSASDTRPSYVTHPGIQLISLR